MKILFLTQYFPPEVGAPQNRLFELAIRLQKEGMDVTVLTAMPNYPAMEIHSKYLGKKYDYEEMDGLKIHRSSIFVSKSKSIVKRLQNYFSFVWSSYWVGKKKIEKKYDYIFCESPPLFLGISAYLLCRNKKAKLIFNVSDLWPESAEKLGLVTNKFFLKLATILEEFLYNKSSLITGQTQGIVCNISTRFPNKKVYWLPNGVDLMLYDPEKIKSNWRIENGFLENDLILLYAGIIGHAQGLEIILKAANRTKNHKEIKYLLLGSGPEKDKLIVFKDQMNLNNVFFLNLVPKSEMPKIVKAIDVALVPLKKLDLFLGAIPSKIFENLAMKKPLLLGVGGEAKELFINNGKAGLFFEPENDEDLAEKTIYLNNNREKIIEFGENGRNYVNEFFNRNNIADSFFKELQKLSKII
ncbi:MAG: glycosyltransferase WbuB [Flavobacteriales bacterium CG_4_9_14_3_um_filter_32_8]|nr:MAG: glycosyltransferase WbuB [Flavobacteriales bacterium CG_4_9_14_3_um_filter_32_8]